MLSRTARSRTVRSRMVRSWSILTWKRRPRSMWRNGARAPVIALFLGYNEAARDATGRGPIRSMPAEQPGAVVPLAARQPPGRDGIVQMGQRFAQRECAIMRVHAAFEQQRHEIGGGTGGRATRDELIDPFAMQPGELIDPPVK